MKPESGQLTGAAAIYAEHTLRVANDKTAHNPEVITAQQATLQNVLSNSLHKVDPLDAKRVADLLALAVKSAFEALGSGSVSDQYTDRINELSAQVSQLKVAVSHARTR